jgi:hypothetical protein
MHIWLVEFKAILHKANFSYLFEKHFLQYQDEYGMKTINLIFPCSPIKFYFWSWNDGILRWRPWSAAQIVRTGDTAKYLDFNSAEVVHVHHCTHSAQFFLYTLEVIRIGEEWDEIFQKHFPSHSAWPVPPNIPYICLSSWGESTQHNWSSQSPLAMAALEAIVTRSSSDSSVPWVAFHKCTYSRNHRHGPE